MANSFQLLVGADAFVREFTTSLRDCRRAGFSDHLAHKAAEGADVRLMVDSYTDVVINDAYPFLLTNVGNAREERTRTQALFERLSHCRVAVKRTAPPGFLGRFMLYRNQKKWSSWTNGSRLSAG